MYEIKKNKKRDFKKCWRDCIFCFSEIGDTHHVNGETSHRNVVELSCLTVCSLEWASSAVWGKRSLSSWKSIPPSLPLSGQYFLFSRCQLHLGPFNSMGQLEIPSCLILTAGMLVCVVTSFLLSESGGEGLGNECNPGTYLSSKTHTPLYFFFTPPSLSVLPAVKDESNWCETFKNEFGHVCHLRSGKEGWLGPGHHHSTEIICYSALIGPDKTIP